MCERCLTRGLITPGEEVHHKTPLTTDNISDPNVTLNFDNLMLLCDTCHKQIHQELRSRSRRWTADSDGKIFSREKI